ncbi:MAG: hypothetical protein HOH26_11000 [Alphaproteobacteria bacterium]|jgi:predicted small lipoprotein YifL|nr:hypothetical protein [Alphaproteobacteria bacterium]MBT4083452.1 hypothetical protein [Alphaproteobacteria bacterium]MBT4542896.1 hypothetical protein [Alphaproteobacteria bacterium]MBT5919051.1 hypothetical protein [Alphaproteobacteria bacterium]MBT6384675.1 hypothetical protein [Alphaproteobacteria bacterium]
MRNAYRFRELKWIVLLALTLTVTTSLAACGKKGALEKPAAKTEQSVKKPK